MYYITMLIRHYLELDMPRTFEVFFDIQSSIAECVFSLLPSYCEKIRKVVLIVDDPETTTFAVRQGADDYLAKPVPISRLVDQLEKALLRRALVLENRTYRVHLEIW